MCTYCMMADHMFKFNPPWPLSPQTPPQYPYGPFHPNIPQPNVFPGLQQPWGIDRLREFQELLDRVKKLEDRLGCECIEPDKPDYIKLVEQRIAQLEKLTEPK